ncbi:MAG: thioredoxin family protein, partial [Nitrospina sp.]|nr:thioredoxin family protein [Nitrospina sp.]
MALMHSTMVPLGTPAVDFKLPGVDGKTVSLESFSEKKILVIIFM